MNCPRCGAADVEAEDGRLTVHTSTSKLSKPVCDECAGEIADQIL